MHYCVYAHSFLSHRLNGFLLPSFKMPFDFENYSRCLSRFIMCLGHSKASINLLDTVLLVFSASPVGTETIAVSALFFIFYPFFLFCQIFATCPIFQVRSMLVQASSLHSYHHDSCTAVFGHMSSITARKSIYSRFVHLLANNTSTFFSDFFNPVFITIKLESASQ